MKQETILETLKNICLNCLANEPSDPTEREIGYSAAMEHIVQIIDKQTNKVEKQTAVEWLFEQVWITSGEDLPELLEQAKEMEKEQQERLIDETLNAYGIINNLKK
jgi:restriction endonuclease Mrr